jgi:hypothetical protein
MRDINEPLRIAYAAALTQVPSVSCYYQYLPNNLNPDNYIVFRSINNNDASTKDSARLNTNITIEIHTKGNVGNQGISADTLADSIFQLVYPHKHTNLTLSRGRILWTQLANDVTQDFRQGNQFGYISRFLTFRHCIAVDDEGDDSDASLGLGQVFRLEYTATGGEAGFSSTNIATRRILDVTRDGISYSEIITTGTPTIKQVLYLASTGTITFPYDMEADEQVVVLYQLSNTSPIIVYEATGIEGEYSITSTDLIGQNIVKVSRDGVDASNIISSGSPVGKEALYETSTGTISFENAFDDGEQIKILYQT